MHNGSKNHGCEALVRSTVKILSQALCESCEVFSTHKDEDIKFGIYKIANLYSAGKHIKRFEPYHFLSTLFLRIFKNARLYCMREYKNLISHFNDSSNLALSIGGDNYCYSSLPLILEWINHYLNQKNVKTVLWGCSIEPDLLKNVRIVQDLSRYALITARESITYNALTNSDVNTNIKFYPDPAFQLVAVDSPLPNGFVEGNTIGINISPLIIRCEVESGITMKNYETLLQYIIETTDMQIALIPHVVWDHDDDRKPLCELYDKFQYTNRVVMIKDHNCMELKGYIARCRMFIGARTHATIAAYSSCVPTLVVGYSVKARGVAKDIFGTSENYVIPVQSFNHSNDLIKSFKWLKENEDHIRTHLLEFMPSYCEKALGAGEDIKTLLGGNH
jgi:Uncharacterized conserved protein